MAGLAGKPADAIAGAPAVSQLTGKAIEKSSLSKEKLDMTEAAHGTKASNYAGMAKDERELAERDEQSGNFHNAVQHRVNAAAALNMIKLTPSLEADLETDRAMLVADIATATAKDQTAKGQAAQLHTIISRTSRQSPQLSALLRAAGYADARAGNHEQAKIELDAARAARKKT
jgi:hypothetical protein